MLNAGEHQRGQAIFVEQVGEIVPSVEGILNIDGFRNVLARDHNRVAVYLGFGPIPFAVGADNSKPCRVSACLNARPLPT